MEAKIPEKTDPCVAFFQFDSMFTFYIQKDKLVNRCGFEWNW